MSRLTPNLNLEIPSGDDPIDVSVFGAYDTIDAAIKALQDAEEKEYSTTGNGNTGATFEGKKVYCKTFVKRGITIKSGADNDLGALLINPTNVLSMYGTVKMVNAKGVSYIYPFPANAPAAIQLWVQDGRIHFKFNQSATCDILITMFYTL